MSLIDPNVQSEQRLEAAATRILSAQLPTPARHRWQPLRAGLMNLFLFEDERFPFADGRLLLRGSNGTGKSRVLAMTLPLLLDGSLKPTRVEPDRDPTRQVAWNLLMDDQHSSTAYTWLEFGRVDQAGDHFLTIGMGLRAVRDQPIKSWFFVTEQRIDESLSLKSADDVPLTQRQLAEALGDSGQLIETAAEYRRVVDDRLFRLGDRYEALIDLLLQLRQPQLAKKLDIDQLEAALRQALPPLPEALLDDAAEAFRDLDHYRATLAGDRQTLTNIEQFLRPYRSHVARGVMRVVKRLTSANSHFDQSQRSLREASEQQKRDQDRLETLGRRKQQLRVEIDAARAAITELQQSPEMRDARRLDELRGQESKLLQQHDDSQQDLQAAIEQQQTADKNAQQTQRDVESKQAAALVESDACKQVAAPEALQNRHQEVLTDRLSAGELESFSEGSQELRERAERCVKAAEHLSALDQRLTEAQAKSQAARESVTRCDAHAAERDQWLQQKQTQRDESRESLWEAILQWHQSSEVLADHLPPITTWSDTWHEWAADAHESDPSPAILQRAKTRAITQISAESTRRRAEMEELADRLQDLDEQRQRLESGEPIEPPPRPGSDPQQREHLDGAPLWKVIEFGPVVPASEHAGWEAALEDSGMLDAWVTPSGHLVEVETADGSPQPVQLLDANLSILPHDRQLARVLAVAEQLPASLPRAAVERLLSVIGVGEGAGETWVAHDGRWQNGPLSGRLRKSDAQYIGEEARERWRSIRLSEIAQQRREITEQQALLEDQLEQLAGRADQVESRVEAFPSSAPVVQLALEVAAAQSDVDHAAQQLRQAQQREAECRESVQQIREKRAADAADFGLSQWAARSSELLERLRSYLGKLNTLEARVETWQGALQQAGQARETLEYSDRILRQAQDRAENLETDLGQTRERIRVLEETAGQGVAEITARLEAQRQTQADRETQAEQTTEEVTEVREALAVRENQLRQIEAEAQQHDTERKESAEWFSQLHAHGLVELAAGDMEIPAAPWSMTQALKVARRVDSVLDQVPTDEQAWHRSQNKVHQAQTELQQTVLSQDGMAVDVDHLHDGLQLVMVTLQGERLAPADAILRLRGDIENRQRILDEKEQETLEKYLLGEVAEGLRKGMQSASELVDLMTREVSRRPMKTGMQMRFKWRRDEAGPPGLAEACEVLATSSAVWSPEEREQIKQFLQRCIRIQRETEQSGSWHDHLRAALDYRLWHRIVIERRSGPDAAWQRLTRRTYGSGSGGEKAISLTLPQVAAAAAYYQTADSRAPRFILLDEAFAGVSSDMRESCMELIAAFGLDAVMTSEIEWGCYAGVRQLSICQLDRFADIGAVVNRTFIWNGSQCREASSREDLAEADEQPLFAEE